MQFRARMPESLLYSSSSFPSPENTTHRPRGGNGLTLRNEAAVPHNQRNATATSRAELLVHQFHIVTVNNERAPFPVRSVPHRIQVQEKDQSDCERLDPTCRSFGNRSTAGVLPSR